MSKKKYILYACCFWSLVLEVLRDIVSKQEHKSIGTQGEYQDGEHESSTL